MICSSDSSCVIVSSQVSVLLTSSHIQGEFKIVHVLYMWTIMKIYVSLSAAMGRLKPYTTVLNVEKKSFSKLLQNNGTIFTIFLWGEIGRQHVKELLSVEILISPTHPTHA